MKKIDDIILITKHFPFKPTLTPGESFLGNEISIISRHAKRVHVFCTEVKPEEAGTVSLPENVKAYAISRFGTKADKAVCALRGAAGFLKTPAHIADEAAGKPFKAKEFLFYFCRRGEQKYRRMLKILEKQSLGRNVLIYSYWCFDHAYAGVLLKERLSKTHHVIAFSRAHRYDLYEYNHVFEKGLEYIPARRWLFTRLDAVCACSEDGRAYLADRYPEFTPKFRTAYIGTQDKGVQDAQPGKEMHIVSCSQLIDVKRVDRLIAPLEKLAEKGYDVEWTHFGGGKLYDALMERAKSELTKCKWNLPGRTDNADIMSYYQTHHTDLFVNVSENEGLPISIMEAVSFGIPVVATDVGGTSEIVLEGKNGYLLKKDFTDEELINTLENWIRLSPEEKQDLRTRARSVWEESFEFERNATELIEMMEDKF